MFYSPVNALMSDLNDELAAAVAKAENYARKNYGAAYVLAFVTVSGSLAATIVSLLDSAPKYLVAILAAIPAAIAGVQRTFNFENKAAWHWTKSKRLQTLLRALKNENAKPEQISRTFSAIEVEMEQRWMMFGTVNEDSESERKEDE
jgi:hypothetical protein